MIRQKSRRVHRILLWTRCGPARSGCCFNTRLAGPDGFKAWISPGPRACLRAVIGRTSGNKDGAGFFRFAAKRWPVRHRMRSTKKEQAGFLASRNEDGLGEPSPPVEQPRRPILPDPKRARRFPALTFGAHQWPAQGRGFHDPPRQCCGYRSDSIIDLLGPSAGKKKLRGGLRGAAACSHKNERAAGAAPLKNDVVWRAGSCVVIAGLTSQRGLFLEGALAQNYKCTYFRRRAAVVHQCSCNYPRAVLKTL